MLLGIDLRVPRFSCPLASLCWVSCVYMTCINWTQFWTLTLGVCPQSDDLKQVLGCCKGQPGGTPALSCEPWCCTQPALTGRWAQHYLACCICQSHKPCLSRRRVCCHVPDSRHTCDIYCKFSGEPCLGALFSSQGGQRCSDAGL